MDPVTPPPVNPATLNRPGSKWPLILGIISIIFGVGGILQAAISQFSIIMTKGSMQAFVEQGASQEKVDAYLEKLEQISYTSAAIYGPLGILLLTGGIILIRRKKVSSILLQIWSVLKILGGGYVVFSTIGLSSEQMDIMFSSDDLNLGDAAATFTSTTEIVTKIMLVFQLVWLCILPIFFLIWFNREKINQQIEEW